MDKSGPSLGKSATCFGQSEKSSTATSKWSAPKKASSSVLLGQIEMIRIIAPPLFFSVYHRKKGEVKTRPNNKKEATATAGLLLMARN
jgi:hypothetical protein